MNNKGYLLVEIIVASVIAMSMMYFLLEITIKLKNINEDYYVETKLETDQILMLKDVMKDLSDNTLLGVSVDDKKVIFNFIDSSNNEFNTKISIEDNMYKYGKVDSAFDYLGDEYTKSFDNNLNVSNTKIENLCYHENEYKDCNGLDTSTVSKGLLKINIPATTIYSDTDYGIKLVIPYNTQEITIKSKSNYFYYTSHKLDRDDNAIVEIYACNNINCNGYNDCECQKTNIDSTFLYYRNGYVGFTLDPAVSANNSNLYFTRYNSSYNSSSMSIYKCKIDGTECQSIINNIQVPSASTELSSDLQVNDKYLYYTTYYSPSYNSSIQYMRINRCDLDGKNCIRVGANPDYGATALLTSTESPFATTGGSVRPRFAINNNHFYYTSYYQGYGDYTYMTIYVCDVDGTNCKVLNNNNQTARLLLGNSNNPYEPEIAASNNYFYYTSYNGNRDTTQMAIYRCDTDGTNCQYLKDAEVSRGTRFGGAFNTQITANDTNFYYTVNDYSYRDGFYIYVYACKADGSSCQQVGYNPGCCSEGFSSIFSRLAANSSNFYYTGCYSSYNTSPYMKVYKCELNGTNCKNIREASAIVEFRSCGKSGTSTYCSNVAFARQNPLISAVK